jgi:raffinose/stachyose/melibiose transport system permease protein
MSRASGQRLSPWLFALPALVVYAVFLCWPAVQSLWLSFTSWDGLSPERPFVGIDNYVRIVEDRTARLALVNNLLWAIVTIVVPVVLGLALAVALHGSVRAKPILRTVFYMPAVLPLVAVATIWGWLFQPSGGAVNETLEMLGLGALAQPWLGQDSTALWAATVPAIWVRTGFPMLLYLAALQTIPRELYESARTDGATAWQQFRHVTFPNLRGAHYIVIALSVIESFKVFDLIYAMTYGGPGRSTQVLGTWMYFNVFQYYEAGYGTAIAVVITLIALAVGIPYVRSQTREQS